MSAARKMKRAQNRKANKTDLALRALESAVTEGLATVDDQGNITPSELVADAACALDFYMSERAKVEGVEYKLCPHFFMANLIGGCRRFFGVELCADCLGFVRDTQEPYPGFFASMFPPHSEADELREAARWN